MFARMFILYGHSRVLRFIVSLLIIQVVFHLTGSNWAGFLLGVSLAVISAVALKRLYVEAYIGYLHEFYHGEISLKEYVKLLIGNLKDVTALQEKEVITKLVEILEEMKGSK